MSNEDTEFWKGLAASVIRKGLFSLATYLVAVGVLPAGELNHFIDIGVGLVLGGGTLTWDWFKNAKHAKLAVKVEQQQQTIASLAASPPRKLGAVGSL